MSRTLHTSAVACFHLVALTPKSPVDCPMPAAHLGACGHQFGVSAVSPRQRSLLPTELQSSQPCCVAARPGHATADTPRKWTCSTSAASAGSWSFPGRTESPTRRYLCVCVSAEVLIMKAQLRWTGHVMRMEDSRLSEQIFCSELARGTRRQGGQTKRYKDSPKNSLGACDIPVKGWEHLAADRSAWGLATHNGAKPSRKGDCHSLTSNA